jgi:DNA-damage-inducible protein D
MVGNLIHKDWVAVRVKEHKALKTLKTLKTQNLHDHMHEAESIFTALAE